MLSEKRLTAVNLLAERLEKTRNLNKIRFYSGELLQKTAELCREKRPFSVVAVLFSEQGFARHGERFLSLLNGNGLKTVSLILKEEELDKNISAIASSLPENARLVVSVDKECIYGAQELAKELSLGCVLGLDALPEKLFKKANPPACAFMLNSEQKNCYGVAYQGVVSKIISLMDIKLKQFFRIIPKNLELVTEFWERLDLALADEAGAIENFLCLELMEISLNHISLPLDIKASLCAVKLIAENLNRKFLTQPNYIERARAVASVYDISYLNALENIKNQLDTLREFQDRLSDIKAGVSALAKIYLEKIPLLIGAYKRLAGNGGFLAGASVALKTLKYAGDIHYYNNTMSLLRETGGLEKIK